MELNSEKLNDKKPTWPTHFKANLAGQSYLEVKTDGYKITNISFSSQRPPHNSNVKDVMNTYKQFDSDEGEQDICHLLNVEVLKQNIKTKYEEKPCDELADSIEKKYRGGAKITLETIGNEIAKEYLKQYQDGGNVLNEQSEVTKSSAIIQTNDVINTSYSLAAAIDTGIFNDKSKQKPEEYTNAIMACTTPDEIYNTLRIIEKEGGKFSSQTINKDYTAKELIKICQTYFSNDVAAEAIPRIYNLRKKAISLHKVRNLPADPDPIDARPTKKQCI